MSVNRNRWYALSAALAVTLLLGACATPTAPPPQVVRETTVVQETVVVEQEVPVEVAVTATPEPFKPQGTLTVGLTDNINAIEYARATERNGNNASNVLYDTLAFPEPDGTYSPALAESWDVSEDGRTYTFHLREGVTFHNGEPFTADAVVYSWEVYTRDDVSGASDWVIAENVEKVDDYTVNISTAEPNALLLPVVALSWTIIPPLYHQEMGLEGFAEHPVGTGPFMFEEWVKGDHFSAVANPNYWREGYPKLERIVFKFLPESATRVAAVQTGEIDIAPRLTADDVQPLLGTPGLNIIRYPVNRSYYLAFNNITTGIGTPLEDPRVRDALAYAIDMDAIIDAFFDGFATRAVGLVGPTDLGYDSATPIPYDPEMAKALMAEAGYPNGISADLACPDGVYPHINEVCQAIRGYWDEAGITGDLSVQEANAFWDAEAAHEHLLFIDSSSHSLPEAYTRLKLLVYSGVTWSMWSDTELDGLIDQAAVTLDVQERAGVYEEIQARMRENPAFIYLYYPEAFEGVRTRVKNYAPRAAENYFLWDVTVSD